MGKYSAICPVSLGTVYSGNLTHMFRVMNHKIGRLDATAVFIVLAIIVASACVSEAFARFRQSSLPAVNLAVPLNKFPDKIGLWEGEDVEIPEVIEQATGNDDNLMRMYRNIETQEKVNCYIAYAGRPRVMLGHKPVTCYRGAGWILDSTRQVRLTTSAGRIIPCNIHRFHRSSRNGSVVYVLNFYLVNGELSDSERSFSGIRWRKPNIGGERSSYVAQIQISSTSEGEALNASCDLGDTIIDFMTSATAWKK